MTGDRAAFMATVADASSAFGGRQARLFGWMSDVPFQSYELVARWDRLGDLARPSDSERYPEAEAVALPVTEERYRLRRFDRTAAVEDAFYTFVKEDDAWRISSDTDLDDLGLHTVRHLWDFGPLQVKRSAHFLLFEHPCRAERLCRSIRDDLLPLAEEALERVRRYWRFPEDRDFVILVPSTGKELARMLQVTFDLENFVAFAYSTLATDEGIDFTAPRIIFNSQSLRSRPPDQVRDVLAHELLHVVTRDASGPFTPVFVEEGFADYVGRDADLAALAFLGSDVQAGLFEGKLPKDSDFTTGDGTSIFRSYQESHSAVRYFISRWGLPRFARFYRRLGAREVVAGTADYHVNVALKRTIGLDYRAFEKAWADSIE